MMTARWRCAKWKAVFNKNDVMFSRLAEFNKQLAESKADAEELKALIARVGTYAARPVQERSYRQR